MLDSPVENFGAPFGLLGKLAYDGRPVGVITAGPRGVRLGLIDGVHCREHVGA